MQSTSTTFIRRQSRRQSKQQANVISQQFRAILTTPLSTFSNPSLTPNQQFTQLLNYHQSITNTQQQLLSTFPTPIQSQLRTFTTQLQSNQIYKMKSTQFKSLLTPPQTISKQSLHTTSSSQHSIQSQSIHTTHYQHQQQQLSIKKTINKKTIHNQSKRHYGAETPPNKYPPPPGKGDTNPVHRDGIDPNDPNSIISPLPPQKRPYKYKWLNRETNEKEIDQDGPRYRGDKWYNEKFQEVTTDEFLEQQYKLRLQRGEHVLPPQKKVKDSELYDVQPGFSHPTKTGPTYAQQEFRKTNRLITDISSAENEAEQKMIETFGRLPSQAPPEITQVYPKAMFDTIEPHIGSIPSRLQQLDAEARPEHVFTQTVKGNVKQQAQYTVRKIFFNFLFTVGWTFTAWTLTTFLIFFKLEDLRSKCLSKFVHLYFPEDLVSDMSSIGYLENYNNLLLEHIITAVRGVYTAKVHPELVPPWIRDMVTKDGQLMDPLADQPPETLLELCDLLTSSRGMGSLTTIYSQFHEIYLKRQHTEGGRPPGFTLTSLLYDYCHKKGWDGTYEQLEAYETLSQYESESELCLPLVREQLHKHITSLLVPPREAPKQNVAVEYLKSVVSYFTQSNPITTSESNEPLKTNPTASNPATISLITENDKNKTQQYRDIKTIISQLHAEAPLPSLIKQRRNKIEQLYIKEQIPFTATLNETHHQIQKGRYETLQYILQTLRSYQANLIATPHKLQQYAGTNQVIMSLDDVKSLIEYCETTMQGVGVLIEKYRTPVREQVARHIAQKFRALSFFLPHEVVTLGLFFQQREKLILEHFSTIEMNKNNNKNNQFGTSQRPLEPPTTKSVFDPFHILPNSWSTLTKFNETTLPTHEQHIPHVLRSESTIQNDYINVITELELDGTLTNLVSTLTTDRTNDMPEFHTPVLRDFSDLLPPPEYIPGETKLLIPIVNLKDPLNTRLYTEQNKNRGLNGIWNGIMGLFGYESSYGETLAEQQQSIPIEQALAEGYITQAQHDRILKQHRESLLLQEQQQGRGSTGIVELNKKLLPPPDEQEYKLHIELDPNNGMRGKQGGTNVDSTTIQVAIKP